MDSVDVEATEKKWLDKLQEEIDDHVFFWTALVVVVFVFFQVPQVAHIWRQAQPSGMGLLYVPFVGFIVLVSVFYVGSIVTVLRPMPMLPIQLWFPGWCSRHPRHVVRRVAQALWWLFCWPPELCSRILPAIRVRLWRDRSGERSLRTSLGVILIAVTIFFVGAAADGSRLFPLAGVCCRYIALFAGLVGLWLFWPSSTEGEHHIGPAVGRLISWAAMATLLGEVIWFLASRRWLGCSYRLYSIWAFCHASVLVLLVALLLDRMHCAWNWPLRPIAITALAIIVLRQGNPEPILAGESERYLTATQREAAKARTDRLQAPDWREEFLARIQAIPAKEGPVVLVAASGGGSRAAIFSALCLELLARTPIAAQPIFSSARDAEAAKQRTFADNIVLISSVSGGSLASADFVSERARDRHLEETTVSLNSTESELVVLGLDGLRAQLDQLAKSEPAVGLVRPTKDYASDLAGCVEAWRALEKDARAKALREPQSETAGDQLDEIDRWLALLEATQSLKIHATESSSSPANPVDPGVARVHWVLHSRNLDRMCTDFMAPLMRGLLSVDLYRGDALARFWTEAFEWHGASNLGGPASDHPWPAARHLPCVIYNATDVAKGRRLAIGLPPLPSDLWDDSTVFEMPERLRPASLSHVAPGLDLALARVVRMSSNFPWGFRVQEVAVKPDPSAPPAPAVQPVRILDGGVVDNTGIDTLFHLATALRLEANSTDPKTDPKTDRQKLAKDILEQLAVRGVLILEIDAGAKPDDAVVTGLAAGAVEPFAALNNAAYSQAERTRLYYLERLSRLLTPRRRVEQGGAKAFHVVLSCNHVDEAGQKSSDVMTAWTLGPRDKADVLMRFFGQITIWDRSRQNLTRALAEGPPEADPAVQQDFNRRAKAGARMDKSPAKEGSAQGATQQPAGK